MNSIRKDRFLVWSAVPVLAGVLIVLAVMQYRWSLQVSAATKAQMQSSLQNSLMGLRQDFSRELGVLCVDVRSAFDHDDGDKAAQLSEQITHWQQTASHPTLLANVYLYQDPGDKLTRIDAAGGRAESVPWPNEFSMLHQHLQMAFSADNHSMGGPPRMGPRLPMGHHRGRDTDHGHGRPPMHSGRHIPAAFVPWGVDQSIPALVTPIPSQEGRADMAGGGFLIIQLNRSVMEKDVFPDLAQKYFHGEMGLDYSVAIAETGKSSRRVAWSSGSGFGEKNSLPVDASITLFGPPFRRNAGPDPGFWGAAGGGPPNQGPPESRRGPDRAIRFEPMHFVSDHGDYEVMVRHQRGSLEAAVGGVRRRNLVLSFGVLVLLSVTMGLILVATQRARRLARMQMDFVAGVSHELRTPLAVISSAAANIADGVVEDRQRVVQYGNSILRQSRHLTHLVEQVLLYASTQRTRRFDIQPVRISSAIETALEGTSSMVQSAGFEVERQIDPGLPPAQGDFHAIVESLQNLITNAVKYGGDRRWLGIRAETAKNVGGQREILLTVQDRGMGIGGDELKLIFEPFYRGAAAVDAQIHGTGLGLPLSRTLIEAIGGRLTASSEPGRGSAFTIHLPVAAMQHGVQTQTHSVGEAVSETTS
jgi:signal transduction histidine kinase